MQSVSVALLSAHRALLSARRSHAALLAAAAVMEAAAMEAAAMETAAMEAAAIEAAAMEVAAMSDAAMDAAVMWRRRRPNGRKHLATARPARVDPEKGSQTPRTAGNAGALTNQFLSPKCLHRGLVQLSRLPRLYSFLQRSTVPPLSGRFSRARAGEGGLL